MTGKIISHANEDRANLLDTSTGSILVKKSVDFPALKWLKWRVEVDVK
jgi:hypothetical protein